MKACLSFVFALITLAGYSQGTLNNYQYVLVPEKFSFLKETNQYGLNTTTKQLLEQKGFVVFLENEALPPAVAANKCNALKAEVLEKKSFFSTNLTLLLKDCQGSIIYKGKEGKSREKEFQASYDLALRDAFASLKDVPYKYDSTVFTQQQQAPVTPAATPAAPPVAQVPASAEVNENTGTLYAQPIPNGYQLVDTTPKKVLTLLKTSLPDYFIAEAGAYNGIVFKKNGEWFFEHYKNSQLVSRKVDIRF